MIGRSPSERRCCQVPRNLGQVKLFHFQLRLPSENRHIPGAIEGAIRNLKDPSLKLQGGGNLFKGSHQEKLAQLNVPFSRSCRSSTFSDTFYSHHHLLAVINIHNLDVRFRPSCYYHITQHSIIRKNVRINYICYSRGSCNTGP